MQLKKARKLLECWEQLYLVKIPADIINLCIKFHGVGQLLAVDKTGKFFVAEFALIDSNKKKNLNNVTLKWTKRDAIKIPKTNHFMPPVNSALCITPDGSLLFKIGGGYPIINDIWMYDFTQRGLNDTWNVSLPKMKYKRVSCSAVSLNYENVIAIGGNNQPPAASYHLKNRSVEMYDINKEIWKELEPTIYPRYGSVAVRISNTKCILIGGGTHYCEIYNLDTNKWNTTASTRDNTCFGGVCWNDQVYIAGGSNNQKQARRYDIHKGSWYMLPDLNLPHRHSIVGINYSHNCVYVHGRNRFNTELYDDRNGTWVATIDSGKEHHPMSKTNHFLGGFIATM